MHNGASPRFKVGPNDRARVELPAILVLKEAADYLGISASKLYRMVQRGEFPAFRVGNEWRFRIDVIDMWRMTRERADDTYKK